MFSFHSFLSILPLSARGGLFRMIYICRGLIFDPALVAAAGLLLFFFGVLNIIAFVDLVLFEEIFVVGLTCNKF